MSDPVVIASIAIFIGCGLALYLGRKTFNTTGRVLLAVAMFSVLLVGVLQSERQREVTEAVWHDERIKWTREDMPLAVHWEELAFVDYGRSFNDALKLWNDRVGCRIFARVPSKDSATVTIRAFDGTECGRDRFRTWEGSAVNEKDMPASAWYCGTYVDIQMKQLGATGLAFRMALHELGHAIGLGHDDIGAMATVVREPRDGDYPEYLLPSDKDVAAIAARFCR